MIPLENLSLTREEKISKISQSFKEIMQTLGLDLSDPSLEKTPERVAKMYVNEIFAGLDPKNFPDPLSLFEDSDYVGSKTVLIKDISFSSFCEHHFLPMHGVVHVSYIPSGKIIGLSKIHRLVRYFSARPQLQERLTSQIADALSQILNTPHVGIVINAKHFCVVARGVQDVTSTTTTSALRGDFETDALLRAEFFSNIKS
jgi:GTP cyclohydrolase I